MTDYVITSFDSSVTIEIDGSVYVYTRNADPAEIRVSTPDKSGSIVYLFDEKGLIVPIGIGDKNPIIMAIGTDTINIDGVTVFADAEALLDSLQAVFFSNPVPEMTHKFGFNLDVDSASTEILASFGGAYDPLVDVMSSDQTFTISYNNSTDGLGTTGALTLLFTIVQTVSGVVVKNDFVHVLGNTGSDVTSFSGLGINRCVIISSGSLGRNGNDITVTATTDGTTQAQIPLGEDGRGVSVTQQLLFHTQQGYNFEVSGVELNALKLSGGGQEPELTFNLVSYSRVTNTTYIVLTEKMDVSISNRFDLRYDRDPFIFGGREVIYAEITTDQNNTAVYGQFYGREIKS